MSGQVFNLSGVLQFCDTRFKVTMQKFVKVVYLVSANRRLVLLISGRIFSVFSRFLTLVFAPFCSAEFCFCVIFVSVLNHDLRKVNILLYTLIFLQISAERCFKLLNLHLA